MTSPSPLPALTIILPAFNEGKRIFQNILRVCSSLAGQSFEVIVTDDGSSDDTYQESLRAAQAGHPVRVVRHRENRGKGAALFTGFSEAQGERIVFLDADLEIAPEYILQLLGKMEGTNCECVIGVKPLAHTGFPRSRLLLSGIYRRLVAWLFGFPITDTQTGIKLFRREVLEQVRPRLSVSRFAFDIELLIAALRMGYRVAEYPVDTTFQREGQLGRIRVFQMLEMLLDTLRIYYRASFWSWLQPGGWTRLWMLVFVAGILFLGIGIGKLITPLVLTPPFDQIFYFIALQFLPLSLRDWLLVIVGGGILLVALVQLNKSLMNAFSRRDRGGLAGLWQRH